MNTSVAQSPAVLQTISTGVDANAIKAQVQAIQQVMTAIMKEGTHYGTIPGCGDKPSLLKPGAEALLSAFKIAVEPDITEIRDGNNITYKVRVIGRHMASGIIIGIGVGEASTSEDKYAWRAAVCDEEYEATPATHRRVKWGKKKAWNGEPESVWEVKQVRTNPADIANTCLKMGKKRGMIDLCLTALAASDCFTQDLEDMDDELRDGIAGDKKPAAKKTAFEPKPKSGETAAMAGACSPAQANFIRSRGTAFKKTDAEICHQFQIKRLEDLPKDKVNEARDWIEGKIQLVPPPAAAPAAEPAPASQAAPQQ